MPVFDFLRIRQKEKKRGRGFEMISRQELATIGISERNFPNFRVGDTIEVAMRVKEGNKERVQKFTGDVIAMHRGGVSSTFTVRKLSANGVFVEKIIPYYSPVIVGIKLVRRGKVRRAKLYYLRDRIGKHARVQEDISARQEVSAEQARAEKAARESAERATASAAE